MFKMKYEGVKNIRLLERLLSLSYTMIAHPRPLEIVAARANQAACWYKNQREAGRVIYITEGEVTYTKDAEEPVVKSVFYMNAIQGKMAWVKPNIRPTKLEGRKGTKRDWKRAHPPKFELVPPMTCY